MLLESMTTISQLFVIPELMIIFMLMMDLPLSCICVKKKKLQFEGTEQFDPTCCEFLSWL